MKRFLIALLFSLAVFTAGAQHYIGLRGGWGLGYGRFAPTSWYNMRMVWGMWSGGLQWKYYGEMNYVGAVGGEIEFIQRAYQNQAGLESEDYYRRVVNSINVPFIWHIHMNFNENRSRVFLNLGVWASYNIDSYYIQKRGDDMTTGVYHMKLVRDNPLGYGLLGGIGFNYMIGRWELMLEARYYFSYGDILRNQAVYSGNPTRSPLDNVSVSLGFFYCLGKEPHKPSFSAEAIKRRAERQMRRLQEKEAKKNKNRENNDNGIDTTEQSSETDTEGHQ